MAARGRGSWWRRRCLAALVCAVSAPAGASDDGAGLFDPDTIISAGGLAGAGPRFSGARRAGLWGLPYLGFRKAGEAPEWWSPDDGFDVTLAGGGRFQAGPVLDIREGRSARDDRRLAALPAVPLAAGLGAFGEAWPVEDVVRLRAEITQGLRAHDGLRINLGSDLVWPIGAFTLSGGPRIALADRRAMRLDFGVSEAAAFANGLLPAYRAKPGLRSAGAAAALAYDWSQAWRTVAYLRYDRLVASAAASPLVRRVGAPDQVSVGLGAIYSFAARP